jgi:hypothetical protein
MANHNPLDIEEYLAALIEPLENVGLVITDSRLTEETDDLAALLYNLSGAPHGWLITWDEIISQEEESSCLIESGFRYSLTFLYPYRNEAGGIVSEREFKTAIFKVNEALNANLFLSEDNLIQHKCLQSAEPFDLVVFQNGGDKTTHIAAFTLDVTITNNY